jgi:hypothetical protein
MDDCCRIAELLLGAPRCCGGTGLTIASELAPRLSGLRACGRALTFPAADQWLALDPLGGRILRPSSASNAGL